MTLQEILNQRGTKTQKAKNLYDLGYTRHQVADLLCNGNYGFAHNIWKKWVAECGIQAPIQTLESLTEFAFNRKFGVEMEFYAPTQAVLTRNFNQSGLNYQIESYNHSTRAHWKFVTDSSISGSNGRELVSPPISGNSGLKELRAACKALRLSQAQINQSCGLHVHIDANDFTLADFKLLVKNWMAVEADLDKIMPSSRRGNANLYCKNVKGVASDTKIDGAASISALSRLFVNRYFKLNLHSFQRHGTVEFRGHSGSCNYSKIKSWVLICSRLVEASKQGIRVQNINQILDDDLQEYFEERQLDFI